MTQTDTSYAKAAFTNGYEFSHGAGYALPEYPFTEPPELASGEVKRHAIVIVGGGITGLTLACALARYGIRALLLDEDNTVGVKGASSRGICYAQKTLEIFKRLGIYDRIAKKGVQWSVGRTFAGCDEVYSFDLRQQNTHSFSLQPPFINIQQFYIEGFLVEKLLEGEPKHRMVDLRWSHRVTAFEQNAKVATLQIATPAGSYSLQAEHVIDCTGSRSPFRTWCKAAVTAKKGDDRWCIADVRFKTQPPVERHTWIEAPFNEGRAVWQHLMADGVWRIDYQMAPDANAEEVSREDVVRARINAQFSHTLAPDAYEIVWVGPYAYRSECLDTLRMGRVFFAGDSAHVVSPFGARGGNSGVQDADNLAWKLAAVSQGYADPVLLDSYHAERHEAAQHNVLVTNRTARFMRPADGAERLFRTAAISLAKRYMFARQLVNTGRMSAPNIYTRSPACSAQGGYAAQNVAFCWADGSAAELGQLLDWAGAHMLLLVFWRISTADLKRLKSWLEPGTVRCVQVLAPHEQATALEHVRDTSGHLRQVCLSPGTTWAMLRPDSYVVVRGRRADASLRDVLASLPGFSAVGADEHHRIEKS